MCKSAGVAACSLACGGCVDGCIDAAASGTSGVCWPAAPASTSLAALTARVGDEWIPGSADAGADGGLAAALASVIRPAAVAEYDRVIAAAASAGSDARRRARKALLAVLCAAAERLALYARGADAVAGDDADAAAAIGRHLVRGPGAEAGDALLRVLAADADDGGPPPPSPAAAAMTPAARTALVASLPADSKAVAEAVAAALAGADAAALAAALDAAAPAAGARLRKLDKKAEKALVADARRSLDAALAAEDDPAAALPLAAAAAFAQAAGKAVSVPGRALGALVAALKGVLPDEGAAAFADYHATVVALLRARAAGGDGLAALEAKLADALPRLKAAALGQEQGGAEGGE